MKLVIVLAATCAGLFAACGSDSHESATQTRDAGGPNTAKPAESTPTAKPASSPSAAPKTAQSAQTGGKRTYSAPPPLTIDPNKRYFATINMDIGDIRVELYPKDAPQHVNNFVFLAREGYYDGVTFHRVIPGFVAQAGDPTGTGFGSLGYTIKDEVNSLKFLDGTLGMAKTGAPNSAGSQWFIDYGPQPRLDGTYTVFGQLVSGRDVLDKITPREPARATAPGTKINTIVVEEQ